MYPAIGLGVLAWTVAHTVVRGAIMYGVSKAVQPSYSPEVNFYP